MLHDQSFGIIPFSRRQGKIFLLLVQHRVGEHWAFPKGHREEGETALEAAMREFEEETGISDYRVVSHQESFEERYTFFSEKRKDFLDKTVRYFLAEVFSEKVLPQEEEILDFRWALPEEALNLLTFPEAKRICQQALKILMNPDSSKGSFSF